LKQASLASLDDRALLLRVAREGGDVLDRIGEFGIAEALEGVREAIAAADSPPTAV
jgi:hypothetical protein